MRVLKILALAFGILFALAALVFLLALTPAVQTWVARKALAAQADANVALGRVDAGFSEAELTDVRIARHGATITIPRLTASYSAWDYLRHNRIDIDHLTAPDITIDLRNLGRTAGNPVEPSASSLPGKGDAPAPRPPSPESRAGRAGPDDATFNGVLEAAKLPFDLRVARIAAHGRLLLPDERKGTFEVNGRDFTTGKRGSLTWDVGFSDPTRNAPVVALQTSGTLGVQIAPDGRIETVALDATIAAEGPEIPREPIELDATVSQPAGGAAERYAATIALLRDNRPEPLLTLDGQFDPAARAIRGGWNVSIRTEQLAALLTGLGLPEIAAEGSGDFSLQPATSAIAATGDVRATLSHLEELSPGLANLGTVSVRANFDGGYSQPTARLDRLLLEATGPDGRRFAEIATTQPVRFDTSTQELALARPQSELARIALRSLPLAWAQPFIPDLTVAGGTLSLLLAVEAEPDGSRVRARSVEPLALQDVTLRQGDRSLVENASLTANPEINYAAGQIAARVAALRLSTGAGDTLGGELSARVTELSAAPKIAFSSQLQARIVSALKPYLPADPGPVTVDASVEGRFADDTLHLARLSAAVARDAGAALLTLTLPQPVAVNLETQTFSLARPDAPAAQVKFGEFPLALVQPFVTGVQLDGTLTGGTLEVVAPSLDRIGVNTTEPVAAGNVSVALDGQPVVRAIDFLADFSATKRGDVIAYEVRRVELRQGQAQVASFAATGQASLGDTFAIAAKGDLEADVAALMQQPIAASYAALSRGRLSSTFDVRVADLLEGTLIVSARELVAREDSRPLGHLEFSATATAKPDGSGTLVAPLTLVNGNRRSDLSIEAAFGKAGDGDAFLFTGRVDSAQLFVDDFMPFAGLAPAGAEQTAAPRPSRDTEPFWDAVRGKLNIDLKNVVYGKDYTIANVRGGATIGDRQLELEGLEGLLNRNPFKAGATVTFAAGQPKPYTLAGSANVQNFEVGPFLRAANPNQPPALEGKITVAAQLQGQGANIGDLAKNIYGTFDLTGTDGLTRLLARRGGAGAAVDLLSAGLAIFGAARESETAAAAARLATMLNEVTFDRIAMHVERGSDLKFKVTSFEILSPILHALGTGAVANRPGVPLQQQPMEFTFQLGAQGALAQVLSQFPGMLGEVQDKQGYQLLSRTFTVGGTPANPDSSALWTLIRQAATQAAAGLLNN